MESLKNIRKYILAAAFIAVLAGVAAFAYRAVHLKGRIPDFPAVKFTPSEEQQALTRLAKAAADFRPTVEESALISKLEEIHLAETGEETEVPTSSLEKRVADLSAALQARAAEDKSRYLAVGDYLAGRFQHALEKYLAQKPAENQARSGEALRLTITGGAFLATALRRKMINPDHSLNISKALPQVLFRYRWRRMGGLPSALDLSTFEQRLLYDFTIRYVDKNEVDRRRKAVKELSTLQPDYDAAVAEALILLEGENAAAAMKILDAEIESGREDKAVIDFRHALN